MEKALEAECLLLDSKRLGGRDVDRVRILSTLVNVFCPVRLKAGKMADFCG